MIARDQRGPPYAEIVLRSMFEPKCRTAGDYSLVFEDRQVGVEGDAAESHDYFESRQERQFALEKGAAAAQFLRGWLIVGRRAAARGADVTVDQLEAVVGRAAFRLRREAGVVQSS